MKVRTWTEFSTMMDGNGRIEVFTEVDGAVYRQVHISGFPADLVRQYHEGKITFEQFREQAQR